MDRNDKFRELIEDRLAALNDDSALGRDSQAVVELDQQAVAGSAAWTHCRRRRWPAPVKSAVMPKPRNCVRPCNDWIKTNTDGVTIAVNRSPKSGWRSIWPPPAVSAVRPARRRVARTYPAREKPIAQGRRSDRGLHLRKWPRPESRRKLRDRDCHPRPVLCPRRAL